MIKCNICHKTINTPYFHEVMSKRDYHKKCSLKVPEKIELLEEVVIIKK